MKIGVCGTGTVASWISSILNQLGDENIRLYACATSPGFDCTEFAKKFGYEKVHASFDELFDDPEVDLVYIAVPNNFHKELCLKAIEAGKNVCCEKPFAINDAETREIFAAAEKKGVFITEALWPSFLPIRKTIADEIAAGTIGEVREGRIIALDNVMFLDRVKVLELGGGTLLDEGPYSLGFMVNHFGTDIEDVTGSVRKLDTGVDAEAEFTVKYKNGINVYIHQQMDVDDAKRENYAEIIGTKAKIHVSPVSNPETASIMDLGGNVIRELSILPQIHNQGMPPVSGYEHEFIAYEKAIREGKKECAEVTHADSITVSEVMTKVRKEIGGVVFPFE